MRKNPVKKEYVGTNGRIFRGRGIKARKNLESRIRAYEIAIKRDATNERILSKPGSMKC
jgi:hypothetical protein